MLIWKRSLPKCNQHAVHEVDKKTLETTVQIMHNVMVHACDMHGVNHTCVGFLGSTQVYMHAHAVFTHTHMFLHVCMLVWLM